MCETTTLKKREHQNRWKFKTKGVKRLDSPKKKKIRKKRAKATKQKFRSHMTTM